MGFGENVGRGFLAADKRPECGGLWSTGIRANRHRPLPGGQNRRERDNPCQKRG